MGREIVYCEDCGRRILEEEFAKGKAHFMDDRPYCTDCRPLPEQGSVTTTRFKKPSSSKIPVPGHGPKVATSRIPKPSQTTRIARPQARPSRAGLYAGLAAGGVAIVIVLFAVAFSGGGGTPPPPPEERPREEATPKPSDPKPAPGGGPSAAESALKDLQDYAGRTSDPDLVLARCDRARSALLGTPFEGRFREIEDAAVKKREERRRGRQLEDALDQLLRLREGDPTFAREAEVLGLFKAAIEVSGARRGEVESLLSDYKKQVEAGKAKARAGRIGPYELDAEGFANHWLILGPFPNEGDKEFYRDYLKTEEEHAPAVGVEVAGPDGQPRKWAPYVATGGLVEFRKVPHLGFKGEPRFVVCYAACWLECERDVEVEIRVGSDDGYRLWVNRSIEGTRHDHRAWARDQEAYPLKLARGIHPVLIKVDQGDGGYGFMLRVVSPSGQKAPGVRILN